LAFTCRSTAGGWINSLEVVTEQGPFCVTCHYPHKNTVLHRMLHHTMALSKRDYHMVKQSQGHERVKYGRLLAERNYRVKMIYTAIQIT
jgi:hypothetical protein